MEKVYDRINFVDGGTPALNATNLNAMSKAIDDIDDRVCKQITVEEETAAKTQEYMNEAETYKDRALTSADQAESYKDEAETSATSAATSAANAKSTVETATKEAIASAQAYADKAKEYRDEAFDVTPEGYEKVATEADNTLLKSASTTTLTLSTAEGGLRINKVIGNSTQGANPSPSNPQTIHVSGESGSIAVSECGKNLLNPTLGTTTSNGVTCTANGDGTYTLNGTATATAYFYLPNFTITQDMWLVGAPSTASTSTYNIECYQIGVKWFSENGKGRALPAGSYNGFTIRVANGVTCNNVTFKPMLTTDTSATYDDFVPYIGQTVTLPNLTLRKVGDVADYVDVENECVVRNVGVADLGGLSWTYEESNGWFKTPISDRKSTSAYSNLMCSMYTAMSNDDFIKATVGMSSVTSVLIKNPDYTDVDTFKTAMANVELLYELATPTTEPLTDSQKIALHSFRTYDGATYLTTSETAMPTFEVEYGEGDSVAIGLSAEEKAKANKSEIDALDGALGTDEYSASTSYAVGDYLISGNKLYKVLTVCKGIEPPNTTYYEETSIVSELQARATTNEVSTTVTISADGTDSVDIAIPTVSGYEAIGIIGTLAESEDIAITSVAIATRRKKVAANFHNVNKSEEVTTTCYFTILYIRA